MARPEPLGPHVVLYSKYRRSLEITQARKRPQEGQGHLYVVLIYCTQMVLTRLGARFFSR
jgi:hypothetical protein